MSNQPEILFYHLTRRRLEDVLPILLETCLSRQWRVMVECGSAERRDALDAHLWTYKDDAFLPHGIAPDEMAAAQPICLTTAQDNFNKAEVRFFVDGAKPEAQALQGLTRAVMIFDGHDEDALSHARAEWANLKAAGYTPTYWQQNDQGKWEKRG